MIHIGNLIKAEFDVLPKQCTVKWLAKELHCNRCNIYNIFNRATIDTELLYRISKAMNHDFFADLSSEFACKDSEIGTDKEDSVV